MFHAQQPLGRQLEARDAVVPALRHFVEAIHRLLEAQHDPVRVAEHVDELRNQALRRTEEWDPLLDPLNHLTDVEPHAHTPRYASTIAPMGRGEEKVRYPVHFAASDWFSR